MSTDREKTPTRLDSQETRINVEEDFQPPSVLGRFSFNQASFPDNSYNPVWAPYVTNTHFWPYNYIYRRLGGLLMQLEHLI